MPFFRRSLIAAVLSSLALSGLVLSAAADEHGESRDPVAPSAQPPLMAAGVIVRTTGTKPSAALVRDAENELPGDVDVAKVRTRGNREAVLVTDQRIPAADAEAVAAELRQRSDVVSASPNYINHALGESPVIADDTYFSELKQLWDPRTKTHAEVKTVLGISNHFPSGGYSSKAPSLWQATQGEGQVVAVVDTGITDHPDLPAGRILPGYDFVTQYDFGDGSTPEDTGRDGNGRDDDAHDMGDWEEPDYCYPDSPGSDSSWHGTHVAGIIGAEDNNSEGIAGVAPGARILPVRVLGLCGGTDEDVADGILWAAGVPVLGAPDNDNPADVINLSLGHPGSCPVGSVLADAIARARSAGAVVVAAAGNDGVSIVSHPTSPATCPGVISVGSTSEYGDRAGYRKGTKKAIYSNWGSTLDISAPGGDAYWNGRGIRSTLNTGTTSPVDPAYAQYIGTSMAAPVVSAGAALIRSLGEFTPAQTESALKAAVAPFPSGTNSQFKKCTTSICGKGILDLSRVPAAISGPWIQGNIAVGEPLTATPGTWNSAPSSFSYKWLRNGSTISGATASAYTVAPADEGTQLSVRLSAAAGVFAPITATSVATIAVPSGPAVTLSGLTSSPTYGADGTATVTVGSVDALVDGLVELRRGSTVIASGSTTGGSVTLSVPGLNWIGGANLVRAAFLGSGANNPAASSVSQNVTVTQATSAISTTLPKTVKKSKHAALTVTVTAAGVSAPTGTFKVYDGSKKILTGSLSASQNGTRTVSLPKITKKGKHKIKVVYAGNGNIFGRTSSVKTLTVK